MQQERCIGIMGAMPEEIQSIIALLNNTTTSIIGQRNYYSGDIHGIRTVVVFSRWGKVAGATTASTLINHFKVSDIIFTGVAGGLVEDVVVGDIVLAEQLIQHDMDARPLMQQFEIPLLNKTFFKSNTELLVLVKKAIQEILQKEVLQQLFTKEELTKFAINNPKLLIGDIASGDQFIAESKQKAQLQKLLPTVLCVEMEGAAVAQVCYEHDIAFVVIRTISDSADEHAPIDFPAFIQTIASKYAAAIIQHTYQLLQ